MASFIILTNDYDVKDGGGRLTFDATTFLVFGVPPYVFFNGIGILLGFIVFNVLLLRSKLDIQKGNLSIVLSIPALVVGAKSFGIISSVYSCITNKAPVTLDTFLYASIVFYGGLVFFLVSFILIIRKIAPNDSYKTINSLAVCIPLFHSFGRIGCFTGGCCYGKEMQTPISINYTTWIAGNIDTSYRIPVQLLEAVFNIGVFCFLLFLSKRDRNGKKNLLAIYLLLYSIVRFLDEFLRDHISGNFLFCLSAAQIISIAVFICSVTFIFYGRNRKNVQ